MRAWLSGLLALAILLAGGTMAGAANARPIRIAALGDSLTAGYGLKPDESFTAVLQKELRAQGFDVEIVNLGVSGDTTADGLARVGQAVSLKPDGVILELGANDGLRGLDPALAEANLDRIIARLRQAGIPVLLAGMRVPLSMGRSYCDEFAAIFPRLASKFGLQLYPFFLDGVAADPSLNQPDGLHPNAQGVKVIVKRILPDVEKFLKGLPAGQ